MGLRPLPSALTLGAAVFTTVLAWEIFTPAPALDAGGVVVEIPAHRGVLGVAAALRDAGVIRSRAAFITLTLVRGSARKLQAGEYEVERATDTMGVLRLLETGRVKQHIVQPPRAKPPPPPPARPRGGGPALQGLLPLASIIDREAVARDEMRLISAVFWTRPKLDMPLQADPTVQYALDKERRALTRTD